MSQHLPYYINAKYPVQLRSLPVVKSKKQFIDECRAAWEKDFWTIERIVDCIERLMKEHNVTYKHQNQVATITGNKGTRVMTARDEFENDIFNDVDKPSDLDKVIEKHLNFFKSNIV